MYNIEVHRLEKVVLFDEVTGVQGYILVQHLVALFLSCFDAFFPLSTIHVHIQSGNDVNCSKLG